MKENNIKSSAPIYTPNFQCPYLLLSHWATVYHVSIHTNHDHVYLVAMYDYSLLLFILIDMHFVVIYYQTKQFPEP